MAQVLHRLAFWSLLLLSAKAFSATPATELRLASFTIPHFIESPDEGAFIRLFKTLEQQLPYRIKVNLQPAKRAQMNFESGQADLYFPGLTTSLNGTYPHSEPVFYKEVFAFVREGQQIPARAADLKKLRIGLTAGYNYGDELGLASLNTSLAQTDTNNFRKLAAGRIDVLLVEGDSGLHALRESGVQGIIYDLNSPLSREPVFFIFQDTPKGSQLQNEFNRVIRHLKSTGQLPQLFR